MDSLLAYMRVTFTDRRLAALVALGGIVAGILYLVSWVNIIGPAYCVDPASFSPSVMVACGHGYTVVNNPDAIPLLQSFLEQKELWLMPELLPTEIATSDPGPFHRAHRYLYYSVGLFWRVAGISWGTLKLYMALMLGVTAVLSFGLFRLGMGRLASAICTAIFIVSPGMMSELPSMRDFCKTPFMLAAILIAGYLLKKPVRTSVYMTLAGLAGLVIGVGIGFRQDLTIALLPCAFAVAVCGRTPEGANWRLRTAAVAVFIAGFLVPAWPFYASMRNAPSLKGHFLVQGLATESQNAMNLDNASYESIFSNNDNFIHATENAFRRRMNPGSELPRGDFWSDQMDAAGRQYWMRTLATFPADAIMRIYGATLRVLRGVGYTLDLYPFYGNPGLYRILSIMSPLAEHLDRFGPIYALAAVLMISAYNFWLALASLFFLLCFCGYTSLQFQFRHAFHLGFVSLWMFAFVITRLYSGARAFLARVRQGEGATSPGALLSAAIPIARRMAVFAVAMAVLLLAPLYVARSYQYFSVGNLLDAYAAARLEPVETATGPLSDWTWFELSQPLPSLAADPSMPHYDVPAEYMVAEFAPSTEQRLFRIGYKAQTEVNGVNFSQSVSIPPSGPDDTGAIKYFFPVYAAAEPASQIPGAPAPAGQDAWSRGQFLGIALPAERVADFKGLCRVENSAEILLWPGLGLPADTRYFKRYLTFGAEP